MIKAISETPDGSFILLGLSEENLRRLREGKPLLVQMSELGHEGRVVIVYGETEEAIVRMLREEGLLDSSTKVRGGADA